MTKVLWASPLERNVYDQAVVSLLSIAQHAGARGYGRIVTPYMRTDIARNLIVQTFMSDTTDDDDLLVMLDADHDHPSDIVTQLVDAMVGFPTIDVLGALYFRRGAPHDPLFFRRDPEDPWAGFFAPIDFEPNTIYACDCVGTGAIIIRRKVFVALQEYSPIFFKYEYPEGRDLLSLPTEDVFFADLCFRHEIKHYVHTGIETGHLDLRPLSKSDWQRDDEIYHQNVPVTLEATADLSAYTLEEE